MRSGQDFRSLLSRLALALALCTFPSGQLLPALAVAVNLSEEDDRDADDFVLATDSAACPRRLLTLHDVPSDPSRAANVPTPVFPRGRVRFHSPAHACDNGIGGPLRC